MRRVLLRPSAMTDLRKIARYSKQEWSASRAKAYLANLTSSMSRLAGMPELGIECGDIRPGYRRYAVGSHFVFYRVEPDRIDIVRILHQRMDTGSHLG
jgi:toxin ParE1/3/4